MDTLKSGLLHVRREFELWNYTLKRQRDVNCKREVKRYVQS